ncbi:MAG: prepilin-type N-terminal cleavage/methylation domain-containing protein [Planctomycetes bacterium]|nr:prepilin-type N-terminal cleavage/methylation domain-containing protein [Planctomycetota bacterium]
MTVTPRYRRGFTLLEILLVMALFLILGAVALPTLTTMYGDTKVRGAADEVCRAWAEARTRSIDTGIPYRFAVINGKDKYRIAPDTNEYWEGGSGNTGSDSEIDDGKSLVGSLPAEILFETPQDLPEGSGGWRAIAVFLPDGSCRNNARVVVRPPDDSGQPLIISVRGLTGIVTVKTRKQDEGR